MAGERTKMQLANARQTIEQLRRQTLVRAPELADAVLRPKRFQAMADATTRVSQIISLFFLGPLVMVSLALIVALNQVMAGIFGGWSPDDAQLGIFGFLITFITLGTFIMAVWIWFQFVRTSAFGFFAWED